MIEKSTNNRLKTGRKYVKILSVDVVGTSKQRVLMYVRASLKNRRKFFITTPNPEIAVHAHKDKKFGQILNTSDLAVPDGIGLAMAKKFNEMKTPKSMLTRVPVVLVQGFYVGLVSLFNKKYLTRDFQIIKGRELFVDLIKLANKKGWKVFLFGGKDGVSEKAVQVLKRSYKKVKIDFVEGPALDANANPVDEENQRIQHVAIRKINAFKPHLLFVALGAPKQEKWLYRWLGKLDIGGGMVVGGAFDYIAGTAKLPPKWMANAGFEWLWRLLTQSKRIKRIITAVIVFPLLVFWEKCKS